MRVRADSAEAFPRGFDLVHYLPYAGWLLCVLGVLALLYQLWRGPPRLEFSPRFHSST